jgi:hypothetical protein
VMLGSLLAGTMESPVRQLFLKEENSNPTAEWVLLKHAGRIKRPLFPRC